MAEWSGWVMGIREGTCWDNHWVLQVGYGPLSSTPEIIITLYVK